MITTVKTIENKKYEVDIKTMFDRIAVRYDLLNHLLSFGIDKHWRRSAVCSLKKKKPQTILDIATGTADLAIDAARELKPKSIIGVDISSQMLNIGKEKIKKTKLDNVIKLQMADAHFLPFEKNSFDAVLIGFGIRNFLNIEQCLKEIKRVLKKDGMLTILEFSEPEYPLVKKSYNFYFSKVLPVIGKRLSHHVYAYDYLLESVAEFPSGEKFLSYLNKAGFEDLKCTTLTFGIASVYTAINRGV